MLNLKAELLQKQKEFEKQKSKSSSSFIYTKLKAVPPKKPLPWEKKNVGVQERNEKDLENEEEQSDKLSKVQAILEAKSKMYDKMTSGNIIPDQESSELFLVDFEQKAINAWRSKRESGEEVKPKVNVKVTNDVKQTIADATEQWVEYVDALGRTRTCLKKDLPKLEKMDRRLNPSGSATSGSSERTLMSDDMRREEKRKEWEEEAERATEEEGPIHYENVRFGEVRELGVGYYAFSSDKEKREEQMKQLQKLREDTERQKVIGQEKKEKEKVALTARLEKVRQRKIKQLQKQGKEIPASLLEAVKLPEEPKEKEKPEEDEEEKSEETEKEEKIPTASKLPFKLREWDEGKGNLWTPAQAPAAPKSWVDPREERPDEFAPPTSYFNEGRKSAKRSAENTNAFVKRTKSHDESVGDVYDRGATTHSNPSRVTSGQPDLHPSNVHANFEYEVIDQLPGSSNIPTRAQAVSAEDNQRIERILEQFSAKTTPVSRVASSNPGAGVDEKSNEKSKTDEVSSKSEESLKPFVPSNKPITINVKSMPVRTLKTKSAFSE